VQKRIAATVLLIGVPPHIGLPWLALLRAPPPSLSCVSKSPCSVDARATTSLGATTACSPENGSAPPRPRRRAAALMAKLTGATPFDLESTLRFAMRSGSCSRPRLAVPWPEMAGVLPHPSAMPPLPTTSMLWSISCLTTTTTTTNRFGSLRGTRWWPCHRR
jgi:hypothetical protein